MGGKSDMRFLKNWSLTPLNLTREALWVTGERALVLCPLASAAVPCPGHVRLPEVCQLQLWVWGLAYTVPQAAHSPSLFLCFWVPVRACVLTWGVGSGSAPSPSKAKLSCLSLPFSGGMTAQWEFCGLGRQAQNPDPPKGAWYLQRQYLGFPSPQWAVPLLTWEESLLAATSYPALI